MQKKLQKWEQEIREWKIEESIKDKLGTDKKYLYLSAKHKILHINLNGLLKVTLVKN